jgi:hypothetical protein
VELRRPTINSYRGGPNKETARRMTNGMGSVLVLLEFQLREAGLSGQWGDENSWEATVLDP